MKFITTVVRAVRFLPLYLICSTSLLAQQTSHRPHEHSRHSVPADSVNTQRNMAVHFTPNLGQVADVDGKLRPEILYTAESGSVRLYLSASHISYVFHQIEGMEFFKHDDMYDEGDPRPMLNLYRMDMELVGASPSPQVLYEEEVVKAGTASYYFPHCPDGITGVKSYNRLVYREIYPKIDMVLYGTAEGTKCDFIVAPGGDPSDIRIRYHGGSQPEITSEGALRVSTPLGSVEEDAPYSYQSASAIAAPPLVWEGVGRGRRSVWSRYRIDDGVVRFAVGEYDRSRPLVIDPTRRWATFYGGNGIEDLNGSDVSEVDRSGNVLITGSTTTAGAGFPTSTGAFQTTQSGGGDVFVVKMKSDGTRLWATLYGGTAGDLAHGIVTDRDRNVFIAGHTFSNNFPVLNAHQSAFGGGGASARDAFCVKFDSNGIRQWGTYYGGNQFDDSYGFAIDSAGNPAMVGSTGSASTISTPGSDQPTAGSTGNNFDAFIVKFNGNGSRLWGTYFGGATVEYGYAAATDGRENIIITGWTNSDNLPTRSAHQPSKAGGYDAFVAKYDRNGARLWSSYYGGSSTENDEAGGGIGFSAVASDGEGSAVIVGTTTSTDFPVSAGAIQLMKGAGSTTDAYIVKFDSSGARQWSTYLGGSGLDVAQGVACTSSGDLLVTGHTNTTAAQLPFGFRPTADAYQKLLAGGTDAFITQIKPDGSAADYFSYYGGAQNDEGVGISSDPRGSIIVAGNTASMDFRVTAGAYQGIYGGGSDAFIVSFGDSGSISSAVMARSRQTVLHSAQPNPTSGLTEIEYEVTGRGRVQLLLVDMLGRSTVLMSGDAEPGRYAVRFDAATLPGGIYFCVLDTFMGRRSTMMRVE